MRNAPLRPKRTAGAGASTVAGRECATLGGGGVPCGAAHVEDFPVGATDGGVDFRFAAHSPYLRIRRSARRRPPPGPGPSAGQSIHVRMWFPC
jgi:hypothetical protein